MHNICKDAKISNQYVTELVDADYNLRQCSVLVTKETQTHRFVYHTSFFHSP